MYAIVVILISFTVSLHKKNFMKINTISSTITDLNIYFFKETWETNSVEWENIDFINIETTGFKIWKQLCMKGYIVV